MATPVYNVINGSDGDDLLSATAQADMINAGAGIDTVIYPGASTDYNLIPDIDKLLVQSLAHPGDSDVLTGVEALRFDATTVDLRTESVVEALYLAYFNRPADYFAMVNFSSQLRGMNAPSTIPQLASDYTSNPGLKALVDSFGLSTESADRYGNATDSASLVKAIFENILGRDPLAQGLEFWRNALDAGHMTAPQAALTIMAAALQNTSDQGLLDAALIEKKIAVSDDFFHKIDTAAEVNGYHGAYAAGLARTLLGEVTAATDMQTFDQQVSDTLDQMTRAYVPAQGAAVVGLVGVAADSGHQLH